MAKPATTSIRLLKKTVFFLWIFLFLYALIQARHGNVKLFFLIFVPFALWSLFYLFVVVHELGHCLIGRFWGYPVHGLEVGPFPYRILRIRQFTLKLGKFPRGGRTLLGSTSKTFSLFQQFSFVAAGFIFEFSLFIFLFHILRPFFWLKLLLLIFYLDQLWGNLFPRFEEGRPANDGALLLEILFPKKFLKNSLASRGSSFGTAETKPPLSKLTNI